VHIIRTFPAFILFIACGLLSVPAGTATSQPSAPERLLDYPVGQLKAKGEVSVEGRVQLASSQKFADPLLYSGNTIRVRSGEASLELILGGKITIHANSNLALLQNHSPYLFTLSKGAVSFELKSRKADVFFTPDFIIKTEPDLAHPEMRFRGEISLAANGMLCVHSREGRLHITTQDNRSFLSIPSGGSLTVVPTEGSAEPQVFAQNCDCLKLLNIPPQDVMLGFQAPQQHLSFWRRFSAAMGKTLRIVTFGLL
jgi:hypothetical protein